ALLVLVPISAASLSDFYSAPRYAKEDYRPLIANIQSFAQPGDNLLAIYPWQIGYLAAYYHGAELNIIETPNDAWINDPRKMQNDLNALTQKNPRVWLPALQTQGRILEDQLDASLRARAYSVVDAWFGTTRLELFLQTNDPLRVPRAIAFENNLVVAKWGVSQNEIRAGADAIAVWFDWENPRTDGLNLSLRLVDRNENIWAQEDRAIENGMQRIGFITPNGAPPGEYALRLAIYRAQNSAVVHPLGENARADVLLSNFKLSAPAQPNLAAITFRANAQFSNGIQLIGSDIFTEAIQPGKSVSFALYWQTTRQLDSEYLAVTQIKNAAGKTIAESRANIAYGIYPPTAWQVGELVRD
ncbi:MAG: hypothetical protein HY258_09360, partial [Chloroflexi bacterium]|nr:hypothetical protein [Chloroflexota bacterium]